MQSTRTAYFGSLFSIHEDLRRTLLSQSSIVEDYIKMAIDFSGMTSQIIKSKTI
jgi:hypothetical protein